MDSTIIKCDTCNGSYDTDTNYFLNLGISKNIANNTNKTATDELKKQLNKMVKYKVCFCYDKAKISHNKQVNQDNDTNKEELGLLTNKDFKSGIILYNEDMFFFKVKSSKAGYLSILTVYEDGTVSTLMRNIHVEAAELTNLPDEDFESIPQAGLMKRGIETYDLYVLLYSKKRIIFDSFAYADEELIDEEKYKNFDELIEFINDKDYATLKVVTKPRM